MTEQQSLSRKDIITLEKRIISALEMLLSVDGYTVLFPKNSGSLEASWHDDDQKLLLPLYSADRVLALFVLRTGDSVRAIQVASLWSGINALLLSDLTAFKKSQCDPVTGLYNRTVLLETMGRSMEHLRMTFDTAHSDEHMADVSRPDWLSSTGTLPITGGAFSLLILRLHHLRRIVRDYGYTFGDQFLQNFTVFLQSISPEASLVARTGDEECAIFMPSFTARQCKETASRLLEQLVSFKLAAPASGENLGVLVGAGYVVFPFDIDGALCRQPVYDQAQVLLRRGRLAAAMAGVGELQPLGYGEILQSGGRVHELLPYTKVLINIGSSMGVRQGQMFSVWGHGENPSYKGDIFVVDVHPGSAVAELLFLAGTSSIVEPGDRLKLKAYSGETTVGQTCGHALEASNSLAMGYGEFFSAWGHEREKCSQYVMALLTVCPLSGEESTNSLLVSSGTESEPLAEAVSDYTPVGQGLEYCANILSSHALVGRYASNSLIVFHPAADVEELKALYQDMSQHLKERWNICLIAGLAPYPYLDFRKTDSVDNCRKAWEYSRLLPESQVGILNSLALNISADKLFSQGDVFGAVQQYQRALVADKSNGLAWNSLGICMACLGKFGEAERNFLEALGCDPHDSMALYNLGYIAQAQGQTKEATLYYEQCLSKNPGHTFAHIRLGQISEHNQDLAQARQWYKKAMEMGNGQGMVFRHFARLCLKEGRVEEAREHLHEALIADPYDAFSMQLLAKVFLDSGEDPELAASLARKSVNMHPENKAAWEELARALHAMGHTEQAKAAELRSMT